MTAHSEQGSSTVRIIALLAVAALVVLGTSVFVDREPEPLIIDERADFEARLVEMCQKRILSRLKAPSEATFMPETSVEQNVEDGAYWKVRGKVDAMNGFGAMGRERYSCDFIYFDEGLPRIVLYGLDE